MKNEQPNQQMIFNYNAPIAINLGDVIYSIEERRDQCYYEPCKVCNDTRKVTVNGITFDCPCCRCGEPALIVNSYKVTRWRIYEVINSIESGYWKKGDPQDPKFKAYRKSDRGYGNEDQRTLHLQDFQRSLNVSLENFHVGYYMDDQIFTDYKLACSIADALNAIEREKVKKHNDENGTSYELPVAPEYDKKEIQGGQR